MTAKKDRSEMGLYQLEKQPVIAASLSVRRSTISSLEKLQKEIESTILDSEKAVANFNKQLRTKYALIEKLKEDVSTESTGLIKGQAGVTHLHEIFEEHEAALHRIKTLSESYENLKKANNRLVNEENATLKTVSLMEINTKNTERENKDLLVQLHLAQEMIEILIEERHINQKHRRRIDSFISKNPNYWECDSISINVVDNDTLRWIVTETYINDSYIPILRFDTTVCNGIGTIILYRSADYSPLIKWPRTFAQSNRLPLVATQGPVMKQGNAILSELASSDWLMVCELARKVLKAVTTTELKRFADFDKSAFISGFSVMENLLQGWPALLRYDYVLISSTTNFDNYQSLSIILKNVRLGNKAWPVLEYKLASANGINENFGQNPRLEFLEGCADVFHSWFAESDDDRGRRLEIRFAMPYAMDTNVWNLLHDEDKLLVTAIVVSLPIQLEDAIATGDLQGENCIRWKKVSESLRQMLIRNTSGGKEQPKEKIRKAPKPTSSAGQRDKEADQPSTPKN